MDPIRIACVRYLNTAPLIEGLEKLSGAQLLPTVPSRIAEMVRSGAADVGLVSLVDALGGPESSEGPLAMIPAGMIGCDGPTLTVRLFSSIPLGEITTVHADTDSHTSVVLCQVLLERLHGIRATMAQFDARERITIGGSRDSHASEAADIDDAWPQAVLLIGDKVVTDAPPAARYPHQLDLGEAWHGLTGLPFVYAVWACVLERADSSQIHAAAAVLDRQRRHNQMRLDWIVNRRAPEHRWPQELARRYLCDLLRFSVGDREREAVSRFVAEAAELGLMPRAEVLWVDAAAPAGAT